MQITHPGHVFFVSAKDIPDSSFPLFLDYVVHVYERFKHYAEEQHGGNLSDRTLYAIIDQMKKLNDSDDPMSVFPIREDLKNSLLDFEMMCESMSRCFTSPLIVSSFYTRLGERLKEQVATYAGVEF
tara:strand:- start:3437 stop:3817 length:381 start_codon:yes stop_codon:yes gene_type:complete